MMLDKPPYAPGDKVWSDYTTTGRYTLYTVKRCYKATFACQSGWLVETEEGIQSSFRNWNKFYHGIDSDWFRFIRPVRDPMPRPRTRD